MKEEERNLGGLRAVTVGDASTAEQAVVLLHGFTMTARDLAPFAHSLSLPAPAWFVFPDGPHAGDPSGHAWWPMDGAERARSIARGPRDFAERHPPELAASRDAVSALVTALPLPLARVVLGGFSQGAMVCCDAVVRGLVRPAALVLLSGSRIAFDEWTPHLEADHLRGLPVFLAHGHSDEDLAFTAGTALRDCLVHAGASVQFHPFDGGHEIPLVVWRALRKFLSAPP